MNVFSVPHYDFHLMKIKAKHHFKYFVNNIFGITKINLKNILKKRHFA